MLYDNTRVIAAKDIYLWDELLDMTYVAVKKGERGTVTGHYDIVYFVDWDSGLESAALEGDLEV